MTATLEQTQSDLPRLLKLVQQGEEVIITSDGRPLAKLSPVPQRTSSPNRQSWLARLRELRERSAGNGTGTATEAILEDLRAERG